MKIKVCIYSCFTFAAKGNCIHTVPMDVCNVCKNGPLNTGEEFCDEHLPPH